MEPKLLMMSYTPTNKHTTGQHATFWEIFKSVLSQTWQVTGQGHLLGTSLGLPRFRMLYTSIRNSLEGRLWERCNVKSVRKNLIFFIVSIQDYVCTRQIAFTLNSYTHRNLIQGHYTSVAHRHSMGEVWGRQGQMKKRKCSRLGFTHWFAIVLILRHLVQGHCTSFTLRHCLGED